MTDPNFERSLRAAARRGRTDGVHPDASLLAAYVDRGLSDAERTELEAHVADCEACMERLAMLGSVNVHDEPELPSFEWSPRQLLSRWGWLVPVATVVVLVAVWERQPSRPASSGPPSPVAPAVEKAARLPSNTAEDGASERSVLPPDEPQRDADLARAPAHQTAEAAKAKDASAKPELQAGAGKGAPRREAPPSGGTAADALALRDKKELDAVTPSQANKIAASPAPAAAAPKPVQTQAAASVAGRADEVSPRNQPKALAIPPVPESVAQGALLKSAVDAPVELASGSGVSIRRSGTRLERSTDNGATWAVDLADAPAGLHVGSCPTAAVCWLGGSQGIVLLRQASGSWTRHVVADGRAAVTAMQAADALEATVSLSDGRRFQTADAGVTWTEAK
jgi:hypothetical protein